MREDKSCVKRFQKNALQIEVYFFKELIKKIHEHQKYCQLYSTTLQYRETEKISNFTHAKIGHFFVLWYWIDVSPAIFKMLISKEIVDGK